MFGTMFGDIGHGLVLTLISLLLYLKKDTFPADVVNVRSLFLVMGIFAAYCGFIYNDFLSISVPVTESCY